MESKSRSRGFASMAEHKQREIARKGGRAAHEKGRAHEFTSEEARQAGRKGGEKVSVNRSHMAEIGRRGGKSSANRRRASTASSGALETNTNGNEIELEQTVNDDAGLSITANPEAQEDQTTGLVIPPEEPRDRQGPMAGV